MISRNKKAAALCLVIGLLAYVWIDPYWRGFYEGLMGVEPGTYGATTANDKQ